MTVVQPEITFFVNYHCPRCQTALEARTGASYGWVRCPRCGRPDLPPDPVRATAPPLGDDVLVIDGLPGLPTVELAARPHSGSAKRIALAVGLLASLTMLMIAFVDGNTINVVIFGLTTLALFAIMGFSANPRR